MLFLDLNIVVVEFMVVVVVFVDSGKKIWVKFKYDLLV